ncbi:adenosine deaminase [Yoonia sp. 208BN28-4]|uniref:adenosine deaminase n=1 Tax=Yoonia sp. 208BN28-4 TaxID=3126505 RepID=UPI0030B653B0
MSYADHPKLELHLHIEGAAPPAFIRGLAREKGLDISRIFDADGNYTYADFDEFLKVYEAACTTLQSPDDFRRLTLAVLEECAKHGVIYAESFISPDFCGGGDLSAWRDYLAAIKDASDEAERTMGVTHKGIVTCIRHFGPEQAKTAARCAAETAGDFIVGFGMGGAEMMNRPGDYAYSFDMAREAGLHLTSHAGEWGGPEMVRETIRDLHCTRIGHGIHAIQDDALLDEIIDKDVVLEVCPGSNVFLQAVQSWEAHPIDDLRKRGVKVTVSTDDPPFFLTDMTQEYENLNRVFGWDDAIFADVQKTALDAAFCDDTTRATLAKRLEPAT